MDHERFDRIAAALGGAATRRAGLRAALAALASLGVGGSAAAKPRRRHDERAAHPGSESVDPQRPCGPTAKDNACQKDDDCCTRYCRPPKKKGGKGRCRCIKAHKKCKKNQTCCGNATCKNKKCTPPATCGATGGACTADAQCCTGLICLDGTCAVCQPSVCASGCAFTSVNDAYAAAADGDTIYIGAGTYPTGIEMNKSITLSSCPGEVVLLEPDRLTAEGGIYYIFRENQTDTTTKRSLTLQGLGLTGTVSAIADVSTSVEGVLYSGTSYTVSPFTMRNCTMRDVYYGINGGDGTYEFTDSTWSNLYYTTYITIWTVGSVTLSGMEVYGVPNFTLYVDSSPSSGLVATTIDSCNFHDNPGYLAYMADTSNTPADRAQGTLSITNSTFTNNTGNGPLNITGGVSTIAGCTITGNKGQGIYLNQGDLSVSTTTISGNDATSSSSNWGAGIGVASISQVSKLTLGAGVTITGNTAGDGAGLAVQQAVAAQVTVIGASSSNVYGNLVGDNCERYTSSGPWTPVTNCSF